MALFAVACSNTSTEEVAPLRGWDGELVGEDGLDNGVPAAIASADEDTAAVGESVPAEAVETVEPTEATEGVEPVELGETVEPTEANEGIEAAELGESGEATEVVDNLDAGDWINPEFIFETLPEGFVLDDRKRLSPHEPLIRDETSTCQAEVDFAEIEEDATVTASWSAAQGLVTLATVTASSFDNGSAVLANDAWANAFINCEDPEGILVFVEQFDRDIPGFGPTPVTVLTGQLAGSMWITSVQRENIMAVILVAQFAGESVSPATFDLVVQTVAEELTAAPFTTEIPASRVGG